MSIEGLWTVEFSSLSDTSTDSGTGIIVFVNGQVLGGDDGYYYDGTFQEVRGRVTAEIRVMHYAGEAQSVFGALRSFRLRLEGAAGEELIMAQSYDPSRPTRRLSLRLRRVQRLKERK